MKTILITMVVGALFMLSSCEKENIEPSKPDSKDQQNQCKECGGSWDITDPKGS